MKNQFQLIGVILIVVGLLDIFILPRILEKLIDKRKEDENKEKAKGMMRRVIIGIGIVTATLGVVFIVKILP